MELTKIENKMRAMALLVPSQHARNRAHKRSKSSAIKNWAGSDYDLACPAQLSHLCRMHARERMRARRADVVGGVEQSGAVVRCMTRDVTDALVKRDVLSASPARSEHCRVRANPQLPIRSRRRPRRRKTPVDFCAPACRPTQLAIITMTTAAYTGVQQCITTRTRNNRVRARESACERGEAALKRRRQRAPRARGGVRPGWVEAALKRR